MPSKRNVSYHAYNAASPMNNRKLAEFDCLLPVWRRGLVFAMGGWTRVLTSGGELPRWMDTKSFPGWLSQRQWDSVTRQAKARWILGWNSGRPSFAASSTAVV